MVRIQYGSDIHLEHYTHKSSYFQPTKWIEPDPLADLLVLAGDIGNPDTELYHVFLQWCSQQWPQIVIISGNHEYYTTNPTVSMSQREDRIRKICSTFDNVRYLQRDSYEFRPGCWILGATLWSEIPQYNAAYVSKYLNDFSMIYTGVNIKLQYSEYVNLHTKDREWLDSELNAIQSRGEQAIVVTHHMPSYQIIHPMYTDHPMNCCFASALDETIEKTKPLLWICGHSHIGNTIHIGDTIVTLNPHGYPGERNPSRTTRKCVDLTIQSHKIDGKEMSIETEALDE